MSHDPRALGSASVLLADRDWEGQIFLGSWESSAEGTATVHEPATGEPLATVGHAGPAAVAEAVSRARAAQPAWATAPARQRAGILRAAARVLTAHYAELLEWIVRETGGVRPKASMELDEGTEELEAAAALARQPPGHLLPNEFGEDVSFAQRVPHGIVGVITPWNVPLLLALRSVAPALAVGNAVILKPDLRTPVSGGVLLARAFERAGLPAGVLSVLPGGAAAGEALVIDPDVAMISFTGSTVVGQRVGELAGGRLKKVALELGGKSPLIVLDDSDLDAATSAGAWASFTHQGQVCMAAGRHLVHERVADRYLELLTAKAQRLKVGDPFREDVVLGPVIDDGQLRRICAIVDESVADGAVLACGGTAKGRYFPPTVLASVTPAMRVFCEEIFGPVAPITTFTDDEEAIALANDTEYGLAAAVHSGHTGRARAVGNRLRAGMVHINGQTVNDSPYVPFGGMGSSGNGSRFGLGVNADAFTQWQWMTVRDLPDTGLFHRRGRGVE